jgi:hypothetical protein
MWAVQILANLFTQHLELGELVIYRGMLSDHVMGYLLWTVADLTPDIVLPAMYPYRIEALRSVVGA